MVVTISTRLSSAAHRGHNIRDPKIVGKEGHIHENGIFEVWEDEEPEKAYERIFGDALKEYNEKQKREDRKIKSYYKKIAGEKKKNAVYEMIIGIYKKDENGNVLVDPETGKEIMREFCESWQERNPQLELIGAYYHADEDGQPHVHIDFVPVADGYKQGLSKQTSLNKALEQQGYHFQNTKATPQILWERDQNRELERICGEYQLIVDHPDKDREHLETEVYKLKQENERLKREQAEIMEQWVREKPKKKAFSKKREISEEEYNTLVEDNKRLRESVSDKNAKIRNLEEQVKDANTYAQNRADAFQYNFNRAEKMERFMQQYSIGGKDLLEIFRERNHNLTNNYQREEFER